MKELFFLMICRRYELKFLPLQKIYLINNERYNVFKQSRRQY